MKIKIEGTGQWDGAEAFDLVLVQGDREIRLGLTSADAEIAAAELRAWMEDHTIDLVEVVRAKRVAGGGGKEVPA